MLLGPFFELFFRRFGRSCWVRVVRTSPPNPALELTKFEEKLLLIQFNKLLSQITSDEAKKRSSERKLLRNEQRVRLLSKSVRYV